MVKCGKIMGNICNTLRPYIATLGKDLESNAFSRMLGCAYWQVANKPEKPAWGERMTERQRAIAFHKTRGFQGVAAALGAVVLVASLLHLMSYMSLHSHKALDDAYITFTYALNLTEGHGIRYNPTDAEPTEGGTSMLHILVAAAGIKLGLDPLTMTRATNLAVFMVAVMVLGRTIAAIGRTGTGAGLAAAALAAAGIVALPETPEHFVEGLETIIFFSLHLVLVCWALMIVWRAAPLSLPNAALGAALGFAFALTRPEGVLIAGAVFGLTCCAVALKTGKLNIAAALTPFVAGAAFTTLIAAFLGWKIWYFGDALPNAYWVKSHNKIFGSSERMLPGLSQVAYFMAYRFLPAALVVAGLFALAGSRPRKVLPYIILAAPALAVALLYSKAIHEVAGGYRYGYPMLAPIIALTALGVIALLRQRPRVMLATCTVGLMGATTIGSTHSTDPLLWTQKPAARAAAGQIAKGPEGPVARLALDLADTGLGQDATIYLSAAGFIPYVSRMHAIDWIGLNNNTLSGAQAMSLDEVWAYIKTTRPDVIQTVVPPAMPGSVDRATDAAFNSPAVKDLLRGRVKLFYYWDHEVVAEMLWREMLWLRDNASFAACYEMRGSWTLFAYVMDASPHADVIADTLAGSARSGCNEAAVREAYRSDPFRGALRVAQN